VSGFSVEWLALREPADVAARSAVVDRFVIQSIAGREPVRILDLGSGTGSNVRYLSSRLPHRQAWRLVDHDADLLARADAPPSAAFECHVADLRQLDPAFFAECDLVTASALFDLVSEQWLCEFVRQCRRSRSAVLAALNYDGRIECSPRDPDDELVCALVNRHQRTDKGFGPALGPTSGARAEAVLRGAGYDVLRRRSDWILESPQSELQRQLIAGWASASIELAPSDADRVRSWQLRRFAHLDAGRSRIIVGHDDVGAVLAER